MKSIVITGVSTGIGYGCAQAFIQQGYHVFGSVRKASDAQRLSQEFGTSFTPLIFDVTDKEAITQAVQQITQVVGDQGIVGLINNAGIAVSGPMMHISIDELRYQFEVNVIGQVLVTQAFLPLLGARKDCPHPPGKILMISSVAGKFAAPFLGPYVGSKHALEGISDAWRRELLLYGIDIIVVGPGAVKSDIWGKFAQEDLDQWKHTDFYEACQIFFDASKKTGLTGFELFPFGQKLVRIFEKSRPRTRYALVPQKLTRWTFPRLLPDRMVDRFVGKMFKLRQKP